MLSPHSSCSRNATHSCRPAVTLTAATQLPHTAVTSQLRPSCSHIHTHTHLSPHSCHQLSHTHSCHQLSHTHSCHLTAATDCPTHTNRRCHPHSSQLSTHTQLSPNAQCHHDDVTDSVTCTLWLTKQLLTRPPCITTGGARYALHTAPPLHVHRKRSTATHRRRRHAVRFAAPSHTELGSSHTLRRLNNTARSCQYILHTRCVWLHTHSNALTAHVGQLHTHSLALTVHTCLALHSSSAVPWHNLTHTESLASRHTVSHHLPAIAHVAAHTMSAAYAHTRTNYCAHAWFTAAHARARTPRTHTYTHAHKRIHPYPAPCCYTSPAATLIGASYTAAAPLVNTQPAPNCSSTVHTRQAPPSTQHWHLNACTA